MRIRGIPFRVHPTWFFVLFLFTQIFGRIAQQHSVNVLENPLLPWQSLAIGFITSLLLFFSVILHELGHSFVAMHEGIKVESITLFFLGGVARYEKECSTPMGTLRIAAAGPLASIFFAILLLSSVQFLGGINPIFAYLLTQVGGLNLLLVMFNLIPALPLDGGVILKSIVWNFTGDLEKGVKVSSASGRFISILVMIYGSWVLFEGFKFEIVAKVFNGFILFLFGWFGLLVSRSQKQSLTFKKILQELKVKDACNRRYRVLEEDQSLRRLSQIRMSSNEDKGISDWVLICRSGRWIGYVTDEALKETPVQYWDKHIVGDYLHPLNELDSIGVSDPLWKAVLALEKSSEGRLLVFNLAGLPASTLDRTDVGGAILKRLGINVPKSFLDSARKKNIYPLGISLPEVVQSIISTGKFKDQD